MTKPEKICDHIGIFTANAEQLEDFYIRALDFEFAGENILASSVVSSVFGVGSDCRFIKLHKDGFVLEIFEPLSLQLHEKVASQVGVNHWGYCAAQRATLIDRLRRENFPIIEMEKNGRLIYFLVDPDGNRIEIRACQECS